MQGIFTQYKKLTKKSGLLLNADKTEILYMESNVEKVFEVEYIDGSRAVYRVSPNCSFPQISK